MRLVLSILALAACGDNNPVTDAGIAPPSGPPQPWTSGTRVKAEVFTTPDGLVALAGRWDPQHSWECAIDELDAPKLRGCPATVEVYSSESTCAAYDLAVRVPAAPFVRAKVENIETFFAVGDAFAGTTYWKYCFPQRVDPGSANNFVTPVSINDLHLGATIPRTYEGIVYTVNETEDGFSIINDVQGGTDVIDATGGRIRARWLENGPIRAYRGLYDTQLGKPCRSMQSGNRFFCAPEAEVSYAPLDYETTACYSNTYVAGTSAPYEYRGWWSNSVSREIGSTVTVCDGPKITAYERGPAHSCGTVELHPCRAVAVADMGWAELTLSADE